MKLKIFILFISFFISNEQFHSQNLIEHLGGVRTDFKFYCGTVDLEVKNQCIIKRAEKGYDRAVYSEDAYGYGYESFHLEFETNIESALNKDWEYGTISFYDANGNILSIEGIWGRIFHRGENPWFYSVDLINIPILILGNTSHIKIELEPKIKTKQKDSDSKSPIDEFIDSLRKK